MWFATVGTRAATFDLGAHGHLRQQLAALDADAQHLIRVEAVHALDRGAPSLPLEHAVVGDLAAALGVERRRVQLDEHEAVAEILDRTRDRLDVERAVADELGREAGLARERGEPLGIGGAALARRAARALALLLPSAPRSRTRRSRGRPPARARR